MTGPLWTFDEFVNATRGRPFGGPAVEITGVSLDASTTQPGDAFFAIKDGGYDGHAHVHRARVRGAVTAVISEDRLAGLGRVTASMVVVSDVEKALAGLARAARMRASARIVAVSGSVGKTTVIGMLGHALRSAARVLEPPATHPRVGLAAALATLPPDTRNALIEIGLDGIGPAAASAMARPDLALVTNVEPDHLDLYADVEEIAAAQAAMFAGLAEGASVVLDRDSPHYRMLAAAAAEAGVSRIIGFGVHEEAEARLEDVVLGADASLVQARVFGEDITFSLGVGGRHMVQNALAVLAATAELGGQVVRAAESLALYGAAPGRGERVTLPVPGGSASLIDESAGASPAAMRAAIALLAQNQPSGRGARVAVLGDMAGLGQLEMDYHARLAAQLIEAGVERVYLAGPRMAALWESLPEAVRGAWGETAEELLPFVAAEIGPGDVVMVKGGAAVGLGQIVDMLKHRHADTTDFGAGAGGAPGGPPGALGQGPY